MLSASGWTAGAHRGHGRAASRGQQRIVSAREWPGGRPYAVSRRWSRDHAISALKATVRGSSPWRRTPHPSSDPPKWRVFFVACFAVGRAGAARRSTTAPPSAPPRPAACIASWRSRSSAGPGEGVMARTYLLARSPSLPGTGASGPRSGSLDLPPRPGWRDPAGIRRPRHWLRPSSGVPCVASTGGPRLAAC
jgi:hypothetical protein